MSQRATSSDFEAYRQEKNYRRQQRAQMERPGGTKSVWEELQAQEEGEIHDRLLTQEVHDFFSDATKMAADIVKKVSDEHEAEVSDRLREDMEEFLRDTIQRASRFIEVLGPGGNRGEEILEADMKNLVGRALDEFRAEGTADTGDKHMGQDPFATDVTLGQQAETPGVASEDKREHNDELGVPTQHIDESELSLAPPELAPGETGDFADGFVGEEEAPPPVSAAPAAAPRQHEPAPIAQIDSEEDLPLAATHGQAAPQPTQSQSMATGMLEAEKARLREALKEMVRQGIMTKDQARDAYREKIGKAERG